MDKQITILFLFVLLIVACSSSTDNITTNSTVDKKNTQSKPLSNPSPKTIPTPTPKPPSNLTPTNTNTQKPIHNSGGIFYGLEYEKVYVSRVVDGDTIELNDGRKIRYLGIDTPETVHPRKDVECFGPEASNINKELVLNKKIRIYKGKKDKDIYDRYLRYIVLDSNEELFVNDFLVKNGYATVNKKYQSDNLNAIYDILLNSQKLASNTKIGLWSACYTPPVINTNPLTPKIIVPVTPTLPLGTRTRSPIMFDPYGSDVNCGDFPTWSYAQDFYEAAGMNNAHGLDRDRNGIACESLSGAP